jgi:hypothetical protein
MKGPLGESLEARLRRSDRLDALVNRQAASRAFAEFRGGSQRVPHFALFRIACLGAWLERFRVDPE